MNPSNVTKPRGTIIKIPDATPGLLLVNGQQQDFTLQGVWKSPVAPAPNMTVDVDFDGAGVITAIAVVDQQQLAKERLNQLSGVAQEQGKVAADLAQKGFKALLARMGTVPLGATVLLWVSWFFLPAAAIEGGMVASMSFTFWGLLGVDFNNPETVLRRGSDHGLFAFLGFLCIAAPFAAPFIRAAWSKYLNAAPLAFFIIGFISIYSNVSKTFGDMVKAGIPSPFSWSWGVFVVGLAALVLAAGALKKPANT
jgi:hypothetical protein